MERRQLARGRAAFRGGPELARVAQHRTGAAIRSRVGMRKNKGDMELALEVPQPRLRAVPAEPAPPPPDVARPVRRRAAGARRRARPRGLRDPLRPLRPAGLQPRPAEARRPRPRRGRRPGGVRGDLALRLDVPAGTRRGRRLAVHGRPERDRRPAAPQRTCRRRRAARARLRRGRARRSGPRTPTSRGACTAPSRSSSRASAR